MCRPLRGWHEGGRDACARACAHARAIAGLGLGLGLGSRGGGVGGALGGRSDQRPPLERRGRRVAGMPPPRKLQPPRRAALHRR